MIYRHFILFIAALVSLSANLVFAKEYAFAFDKEIDAFERQDRENTFPQQAILFVGSSSINYWPTAEAFADKVVINRGFGGAITDDVLHVYNKVIGKYNPSKVVIYVGDNDIAKGMSVAETTNSLKQLFDKIHDDFAKAKIIFIPIKPSILRWSMWSDMQKVNANISQIADKTDYVTYVDMATPLLNNKGEPDASLFIKDGLHLNAAGYVIWNKTLAPYL
ncbi:GDSL-type esterase/lipase family protein [Neptunicella marina]|uniref:Lipolytic enzyme n=1 Tax=Neptunicella marina TaxID=2125989 RepID=A0A8J6M0J7_9ALTE|nr:GDSL-type esterase/lipase family protein [Neptunicella marina]MBC3767435.1 lipolytic enzyme [Neptunicella marina]